MERIDLFNQSVKDLFQSDKLESYSVAFDWWERKLTQAEARAEAKATNNRDAYMIYTNGVYVDKLENLSK